MRSKLIIVIIGLMLLTLPLSGALCSRGEDEITNEPVSLNFWITTVDKKNFESSVNNYQLKHPNVTIEITEKENFSTYETELVDAVASGNGPDVAMIKNDWMPKHYDKFIAMPKSDEKVGEFREVYVDVVGEEMVIDNNIFGTPAMIDTLALFYNEDDILAAKLREAPENWEEFIYAVKKLTKRDSLGNITHAGAALGTSNNVAHSQDILYNLMLQNNTRMVSDDKKSATFNTSITKASGDIYYPGTSSLGFYTSFSNPSKETYTWNSTMKNSLEAFAKGEVSMIFAYLSDEETIYNFGPTRHYEIAPMLQIKDSSDPVTYPNYFAYIVTNNSQNSEVAWDFVNHLAKSSRYTKKELVSLDYQAMVNGRSVFQGQPYIARSWYKSKQPREVDKIFNQVITNVVNGQPLQAAIDAAAASVTEILQKKG